MTSFVDDTAKKVADDRSFFALEAKARMQTQALTDSLAPYNIAQNESKLECLTNFAGPKAHTHIHVCCQSQVMHCQTQNELQDIWARFCIGMDLFQQNERNDYLRQKKHS